jgi:hypothetical protein
VPSKPEKNEGFFTSFRMTTGFGVIGLITVQTKNGLIVGQGENDQLFGIASVE